MLDDLLVLKAGLSLHIQKKVLDWIMHCVCAYTFLFFSIPKITNLPWLVLCRALPHVRKWVLSICEICIDFASDLLSFIESTWPAAVWPQQWRSKGFTKGPWNQQNSGHSGYKKKSTCLYVVTFCFFNWWTHSKTKRVCPRIDSF